MNIRSVELDTKSKLATAGGHWKVKCVVHCFSCRGRPDLLFSHQSWPIGSTMSRTLEMDLKYDKSGHDKEGGAFGSWYSAHLRLEDLTVCQIIYEWGASNRTWSDMQVSYSKVWLLHLALLKAVEKRLPKAEAALVQGRLRILWQILSHCAANLYSFALQVNFPLLHWILDP